MTNIDYSKLSEITVKNQEELDLIPLDFKGRIYIEFGEYWQPAVVRNKYYYSVVARGNSSVEAWGNSSVEARGNSSVEAWGNSSVEAWGNSSVEARGNSSVVAWENSSVEARGNSSVEANANVQVIDCLQGAKIQISGDARIVYNPKTIHEFMDFYGIKHDKKKAIFYKAVHEENGQYYSDYRNSYTYDIQKTIAENCDTNTDIDCSHGIHIATLQWALNYGHDWDNLAILEVETEIKNIILPQNSVGKVRTSECFIVRELPLEECGLYGKILAKRRKQVETSC